MIVHTSAHRRRRPTRRGSTQLSARVTAPWWYYRPAPPLWFAVWAIAGTSFLSIHIVLWLQQQPQQPLVFLLTQPQPAHDALTSKSENTTISVQESQPPTTRATATTTISNAQTPADYYRSETELHGRSRRFPSVEDRVRLYMLDWYLPPCDSPRRSGINDESSGQFVKFTKTQHTQINNSCNNSSSSKNNNTMHDDHYDFVLTEIDSTLGPPRTFRMSTQLQDRAQAAMVLHPDELRGAVNNNEHHQVWQHQALPSYARDVLASVFHDGNNNDDRKDDLTEGRPPILAQLGDGIVARAEALVNSTKTKQTYVYSLRLPLLMKARPALIDARVALKQLSSAAAAAPCARQPTQGLGAFRAILWLLNEPRHFGARLDHVFRDDIAWGEKRNSVVFRGHLTGTSSPKVEVPPSAAAGHEKNGDLLGLCETSVRCRLVYHSARNPSASRLVDAKLTSTGGILPDSLHGVALVGPSMSIAQLLQYQGIIVLEGNDVASGLKWALLSHSVVFMSKPKATSWAMEELLEPWVHYIPISPQADNVLERVQWMRDHPVEAQQIAHRATLWMLDLYFHPNAWLDKRRIDAEILKRYALHFREQGV